MLIYICDDSQSDRLRLRHHLQSFSNMYSVSYSIIECSSATELLNLLKTTHNVPDIIFMDIIMDNLSGMEAAKILRERGYTSSLIFTTASTEHAVESYKTDAEGYLVKPYTHEDFIHALERCRYRWYDSQKTFSFLCKKQEITLPINSVHYIETYKHSCLLHTATQEYKVYKSMTELSKTFTSDVNFYLCGRSYLINFSHISNINENQVVMNNNVVIYIPVRCKKNFLKAWNTFLIQRELRP